MPKYDVESLCNDLKDVCISKLNAKLTELSAEKADGVELPPVPSDAYFFQSLAKSAAGQHPVFMFYGLENPTTESIGAHTMESHAVDFVVCLRDRGDGEKMTTRLLRYSRALKEIFEQAFVERKIGCRIEVSSLTPTHFGIENVPHTFHGVGVKIGAVLG